MNIKNYNVDEKISLASSLEFINDGIIIVGADLEVIFLNDEAKNICGRAPSGEMKDWPSLLGIYQLDRKTLLLLEEHPVYRAFHGENLHDLRVFIKNDDLQTGRTISCSGGPIKTPEGKTTGAFVFFKDITRIIGQEEFLNQERSFFYHILNSFPAYVFSKDLTGKITFKNKKCDELKDASTSFLSEGLSKNERRVLATLEPFESETDIYHLGQKRNLHIQKMPLFDLYGKSIGVSGIAFDTTEAVHQKKWLDEEQARLASASKLAALGMLAAELSHEINNPLAIIRTSSWILKKMLSSETIPTELALEKLHEIDETIQRISEIITSVKNLSRDSSREDMSETVISDVLKDVQSICGPKFKANGIDFRFDYESEFINFKLKCSRIQLYEVFINLIVNAIDALEGLEDERRWISLNIIQDSKTIIFRVCDGGPGVSDEVAKEMFTPFFSTKEVGRGTGLGLSISREIMKKHGGALIWNPRISASCFDVNLPH